MNKALLILMFSCLGKFAFCQEKPNFNFPSSIPKPCWVDKLDWTKPNIHQIEALLNSCPDADEEEEEEPYKLALRRWLRSSSLFIMPNGDVVIKQDSAQKRFNDAIFNQQQYLAIRANPIFRDPIPSFDDKPVKWISIGPNDTYEDGIKKSWQANIYCLTITPTNPNILYCGSETGVLFKSINKGLTWTSISDALPNNAVTAIAVSPNDTNLVITAMGEEPYLVLSRDAGTTWNKLTFTGGRINEIIINDRTNRILVAALNGIYYSDNQGNTWTKANTSVTHEAEIFDIAFHPTNPSIVYAVSATNITTTDDMRMYLSTNGGQSFTAAAIPAQTYCTGARFGVSPANSNTVYCITLQNDVPKLLVSRNSGANWSLITTFTGQKSNDKNEVNGMSNGQGYYDLDIVVSPTNINEVIVGTTSAYVSRDGGINFSPLGGYVGPFNIHPDIQWMVAHGNDTYITTDGGVNYSPDFFKDPAKFEPRNVGLTASDNWGFDQGWSEDLVVGGRYHNGNAALYEPYGKGISLRLGGAEDATGHVFEIPGEKGIAGFRDLGTALKQIPFSTAGSRTETEYQNTQWPSERNYGQFSSKLMQDPTYANVIYVGNRQTLWRSENYGTSYTELKNFGSAVWRFDIARSNPNVLYVCTEAAIFKTTDQGKNWSRLSLPNGVNYNFYNTDITINPANENEVWFCMANGASNQKVFRTTNGGNTWENYTGTSLINQPIAFILAQGGTNSGVYAITNSGSARVFYRNAAMPEWVDHTGDLPKNLVAQCGGKIFYRDNKLRITGNRGTWETALHDVSKPLAMPLLNKKFISCSKDTVILRDHSILNYTGARFQWQIPGAAYISSTTDKEIKVTFARPGNYDVTLTVTDANGNSSSKTLANAIQFTAAQCGLDSVPGKALSLKGDKKNYSIGKANIRSNTFTISCWFKPDGLQKSFSQLIAHDPYPGSEYGFGLGFAFLGYTSNLNLAYTDNLVGYGNQSGLFADSTKWNHVALVYSPTGVFLYLNGIQRMLRSGNMPVIDLRNTPFYINRDIHNQGGDFKGEIDEIKIYNYALTQEEIREKMHLINERENGLIKYVQFNLMEPSSKTVYELIDGTPISLSDASVWISSSAPVGKGISVRKMVNAAGIHRFDSTGVNLYFPSTPVFPSREWVVFKLQPKPTFLPDSTASYLTHQYIIHHFGTEPTVVFPDSAAILGIDPIPGIIEANKYRLFSRNALSYGRDSWNDAQTGFRLLSKDLYFNKPSFGNYTQWVIAGPTNNIISNTGSLIFEGVRIRLYPNPFDQTISIDLGKAPTVPVNLVLLDSEGRILRKWVLAQQKEMITIGFVPAGLYLLQLNNGNSKLAVRVLRS